MLKMLKPVLASLTIILTLTACGNTDIPGPPITPPQPVETGMPALAAISYWQPSDFAKLPSGSIGAINPHNGILDASPEQIERYRPVVLDAKRRGIKLVAYVSTGFGVRDPDADSPGGTKGQSLERIKAQVDGYVAAYGADNIYGILFDEVDEPCAQAQQEYPLLSTYVRSRGVSVAIFNPGWVDDDYCFAKATPKGDIIVTYESGLAKYLDLPELPVALEKSNQIAHANGAKTWTIIHSAVGRDGLKKALDKLRERQPDYAYVTDRLDWKTGDNTWGTPPSYWDEELKCLIYGVCP